MKEQIFLLTAELKFLGRALYLKIFNLQFNFLYMQQKGFSVILSDMCPSVSGITTKDAALSAELGMKALDVAVGLTVTAQPTEETQQELQQGDSVSSSGSDDNGVLKPGGHLVIKLLESEDVQGEKKPFMNQIIQIIYLHLLISFSENMFIYIFSYLFVCRD